MNTASLKPAFRYQLKDYIVGFAPFYAVIVAIVAASLIGTNILGGEITFSGFGIASAICLMVFGIVSPRPNLRLCIQLGVSRRTAFVSQLLALAVSAGLLALLGELLIALGQAIGGTGPRFYLSDLYQILYVGMDAVRLTFGQHLLSGIFNWTMMLAMFALGMFFTFLFWRLNKGWTVLAAICIPVALNVVPFFILKLCTWFPAFGRLLMALGNALVTTPWTAMVTCLVIAAIFTAISWLLVRRANIKAPQN